MTHIFDTSESFSDDAMTGFCAAHGDTIRAIPGGCLRAAVAPHGKVAVVVGGGAGHFPAFSGYVGRGLADAAAIGDVFASPSTRLIYDVARLADHGGGILLGYGNYAGDTLNFGFAAERLKSEGIDVRLLAVSDDVASAPIDKVAERRGVCGDLVVFKIAGASAERGDDIDTVERLAQLANTHTRTFGVAFSGCTLPGATKPLFTVDEGKMALGLGIHGEPGIEEVPIASAHEIARIMVNRVLADRPPSTSGRVAVILNGLGSTKSEELFVLWRHVHKLLGEAGCTVVSQLVGEFITSFDMAGCSLTLTWLTSELEPLWEAACDTPALRCGALTPSERAPEIVVQTRDAIIWPSASDSSRALGRQISEGISHIAKMLHEAEDELGRIDAQAGDGDHGQGMARGSAAAARAAAEASAAGAGAASVLISAGDAWADRAGGTSGAIWGLGLRSAGQSLSDTENLGDAAASQAAGAAMEAILRLGRARPGDKTLVDALDPFVTTLSRSLNSGLTLAMAWATASQAATTGAEKTASLVPRMGRARPLAERSKGHRDAGAVSLAMCAATISRFLET